SPQDALELAQGEAGIVAAAEKKGIDDILYLAEHVEKVVAAQKKIRMALLKLAQSGDWIVFGDAKSSKAELGFAGAMRIGSTLGVSFTNWSAEKERGTDVNGEWYRWNFECDAAYKNRIVRVYGRAASRDKFFGKAYGKYKELHDIDEGNIKMAARRGAMKEGVKVLFGLHHQNPNELKDFGIGLDYAGGHAFQSSQEQVTEVKSHKITIATSTKMESKQGGSAQVDAVSFQGGGRHGVYDVRY
ncbi:unnamed protein product, partial [marine sediment metagenome]